MIDCDGEGTYEVVRRTWDSGNEDSRTGQKAHPASWPVWSAGANLIVDRRALAYPVNGNVRVLLVKAANPEAISTAGKLRVFRRSRPLKLGTGINGVTSLVVVVPIATMMCLKVSKTSEKPSRTRRSSHKTNHGHH